MTHDTPDTRTRTPHGRIQAGALLFVVILLGSLVFTSSPVLAQEGLTFRRFDVWDGTPETARPDLEARILADFTDMGEGYDWGETLYGLGMTLGSGWKGPRDGNSDNVMVVPGARGFAAGQPWAPFFFEADGWLGWPVAADGADVPSDVIEGDHRVNTLLTWGREHGFDILTRYRATHGRDVERRAGAIDIGPAPFFEQKVSTTLRGRAHFDDDFEFALSADYDFREVAYGHGHPLTGLQEHTFAGGLWQCFEQMGPGRCINIMRYEYRVGFIDHVGGPAPRKICDETGKCGFAAPVDAIAQDDRPEPIDRYESFSMRVGFINDALFENVKMFFDMSPTWTWASDTCSFFGESDLTCGDDQTQWRRGGWMFNGSAGYTHTIDNWAWGLVVENRTGPSPDGRMLGSNQRLEAVVGMVDPDTNGFGFRTEFALDHFGELFCSGCQDEDEELTVDPGAFEDNARYRLVSHTDLFWDFDPSLRVGATWDTGWGHTLDSRSWAMDDHAADWWHEGRAYLTWRPTVDD